MHPEGVLEAHDDAMIPGPLPGSIHFADADRGYPNDYFTIHGLISLNALPRAKRASPE